MSELFTIDNIVTIIGLFTGGGLGAFFTWRYQKRKAQAEAAKAAMAPAPAAAPVAVAPELAPAQVAAIAAGIYDAAQSSITPQVVAAIAAAVKVTVGNEARILDIKPVDPVYGQGGRAVAMNNSPVR